MIKSLTERCHREGVPFNARELVQRVRAAAQGGLSEEEVFAELKASEAVGGVTAPAEGLDIDRLEGLENLGSMTSPHSCSAPYLPPEYLPPESEDTEGEEFEDTEGEATAAGPPTAPAAEAHALRATTAIASLEIDGETMRRQFVERLTATPFMQHKDPLFMHGRGYAGPMRPPRCTWSCKEPPRDDHSAPKWLTASEFTDEPDVAVAKARMLADLMRISRKTVAYTGAGISAAVIGQSALSGENKVGWMGNPASATPTFTHYALGHLGRQALLHGWVQQNHDGLPQKAGYPQELINEIHGSWYDPGNPVVKFNGTLHKRAYPWMTRDAETADLVLVLGTSLGGLNADQVATNAAERSLLPSQGGGALGTVIFNLQQTPEDGKMTLRLFGRSDDLLKLLLRELFDGKLFKPIPPVWPKTRRVLVPYDEFGRRLPEDADQWMWLDLNDRKRVQLTHGHNIQGAKQPLYMHIGAKRPITVKGQVVQPGPGKGSVIKCEEGTTSFVLSLEGAKMRLGIWWLECAARGAVECLPLINEEPEFAPNPVPGRPAIAVSRSAVPKPNPPTRRNRRRR
eukprot:NODE_2759_length_2149_cov_31.317507.p1 GENE.NODE_2759_length_2149_cov_31.317507~~NODE_2759_length_2149_cov_31.317507.p1  ORF type:complete len:570 (-),score=118.56 NODE_2759_length_2149_cov_31.317507:325-2034(-)